MPSWAWLLLGAAGGYALARSGGSVGYGLNFSVGAAARGAPPGSGVIPLDQPAFGGPAYQDIGSWDAQLPGGAFATSIDNRAQATILDGGPLS